MSMATADPAKRRARPQTSKSKEAPQRRDCTLHFRIPGVVLKALKAAANAEKRTTSAWVAICVEERLKSEGYLS